MAKKQTYEERRFARELTETEREALKIGAEETATAIAEPPSRFRVSLAAQTPLAHAELEVEAASEEDAKAKFCQANGISGSDCDWHVTRL